MMREEYENKSLQELAEDELEEVLEACEWTVYKYRNMDIKPMVYTKAVLVRAEVLSELVRRRTGREFS